MTNININIPYCFECVDLNVYHLYIHRQDDTLSKSVGEGKIFYQPDEADDFDEEDPDDDLDIWSSSYNSGQHW